MTQNIYDDATFFAGYSRLGRSVEGLDGAPEWPALRAMLPALRGLRIVDLGCGFGWFCRWARAQGAARVLGIDVSERMLERARGSTEDGPTFVDEAAGTTAAVQTGGAQAQFRPVVSYQRADMERLLLPAGSFDLAYSSLALHYVADLGRLLAEVHRALVPGGTLVASVEHPIFTAPSNPGWSVDATGRKNWPVDGYLIEGKRSTDWLAKGVIKQHRTFTTYVGLLLRLGFTLSHLEEWGPTDAQIAARPSLADERRRPTFLLLRAQRT